MTEKDLHVAALAVIEKCEDQYDPKEYAMFKVRKLYEQGYVEEAAMWMQIANIIGNVMFKRNRNKYH